MPKTAGQIATDAQEDIEASIQTLSQLAELFTTINQLAQIFSCLNGSKEAVRGYSARAQ